MNKQELKEYLKSKRFSLILIILIIMWLGLMLLFYLKADEVTKHPCSICAEKVGTKVICSTYDGTSQRIFNTDFTIEDINSGRS